MDKKSKIKNTLKIKLKQETSATGTGASVTPGTGEGVATKYAFGKRDNKGTPKDWKAAPSIPNRKSKAMDYKELWEGNKVEEILSPEDYEKAKSLLDKLKNTNSKLYNAILQVVSDIYPHDLDKELGADIAAAGLQEGYAQFRNETKMRSKPDQFHQAVKQIKKKMNEINRIFEYVDRLKSELSEGEDLKYKKYTENAFTQIKESAKQLFLKSTKLK